MHAVDNYILYMQSSELDEVETVWIVSLESPKSNEYYVENKYPVQEFPKQNLIFLNSFVHALPSLLPLTVVSLKLSHKINAKVLHFQTFLYKKLTGESTEIEKQTTTFFFIKFNSYL